MQEHYSSLRRECEHEIILETLKKNLKKFKLFLSLKTSLLLSASSQKR